MDKKKLAAFMAAAMLLTGCSKGNTSGSSDVPQTSATESSQPGSTDTAERKTVLSSGYAEADAVVAESADCGKVTFGEFIKEYRYFLASNGIADDTTADYADYLKSRREYTVNYLINERIIQKKFAELCEPFTEEELENISSSSEAQINQLYSKMAESIVNNSEENMTEQQLLDMADAAFENFLISCEMTEDDIYNWAYSDYQHSKLVSTVCSDVELDYSEAEERAKSTLEGISQMYEETPESYIASDYASIFIPEGSRYVQHILLMFDSETINELTALRTEDKNDEADALRSEKAAAFDETKTEIMDKISAGEEFTALMAEYSKDGDVTASYLVAPKTQQYIEGFAECALGIADIGGIDVCVTDYGVHIIKYTEEAVVTEETYKNTVDGIYQYLLSNKRTEKFTEYMNEWREEYNFTVDRELLLLD